MASLVSVAELRKWPGLEDTADDDQFAQEILEAASEAVRLAASQPAWTTVDVPLRARQIVWHLAARSLSNPDSIEFEGAIGPLGGDRRSADMAIALHLTDAERAELEKLAPVAAGPSRGSLWIQPIGSDAVQATDIFLADDSGSDWLLPYLAPDDLPALG